MRRFSENPRSDSASQIQAARRLWDEGLTYTQIAQKLHVSKGTISGIATRNNFPPRRVKDAPAN